MNAQVSELLRSDGAGTGAPLGGYYLGFNQPIQVILGTSANGYTIASVQWSYTYTYAGCTDTSAPGSLGTGSGISITASGVGTYAITANITYQARSTNPPTTPAPNTVTGTFTIGSRSRGGVAVRHS